MAGAFNQAQMAMAEAYINGLEIPDSLFRGMIHASMPVPVQGVDIASSETEDTTHSV
jgi:hypothetical protein